MNLYVVGRTMTPLAIPWGLSLAASPGGTMTGQAFGIILLFFCAVFVAFAVNETLWALKYHWKKRLVFRLAAALPEIVLLCLLTLSWWLVFPGHIALAIGAWWVGGILLILIRYAARKWALHEAILHTKDYRLFGHRTGRFSGKVRHDKAALYELPDRSVFSRHTLMALVGHEPEIYVGAELRRMLDPDELRAGIAHELGHAWSQHDVGYELGDWLRKLFCVPILVSAGSAILSRIPWVERNMVFAFLTMMTLAWQLNLWASHLLGRPRELGADLYAVEMTKTPQAFVAGMRKLVESEPYNVFPNLLDALGFHSHPCLIRRLDHLAATLNSGDEHSRRKDPRGRLVRRNRA